VDVTLIGEREKRRQNAVDVKVRALISGFVEKGENNGIWFWFVRKENARTKMRERLKRDVR